MNKNAHVRLFQFIIIGFNVFTILLYLFPPIHRVYTNDVLVTLYIGVSIVLMNIGLSIGYRKGCLHKLPRNIIHTRISIKIIRYLILFHSITFLIRYSYLLGFSPTDISGMITRIGLGIVDPGMGYYLHQHEHNISPIPWSIFFFQSAIDSFFFIITFISWKELNKVQKALSILFVSFELLYWLGIGTNFGVIIMITNILFSYLLRDKEKKSFKDLVKLRRRNILVLAVSVILGLTFFMSTMINRTGDGDSAKAMDVIENNNQINYDNLVVKILPESIIPGYYYVYSYCCQGYDNLGKAMNCDWKWTRMVGNNSHLLMLVNALVGYDAFEDSYMLELEKKYYVDSAAAWHSAYLWWAGDVTIIGALAIVFALALLCGYAISFTMYHGDRFSGIFVVVFANMLLFMFANNTYLSEVWYSFMFLFPYWLITRFKKNKRS